MTKPIIEIKNLSAGYDGRNVLHDINLAVYERDFLGIIGPNGCGKTTLLQILAGLLVPSSGEVWIDGKNMKQVPADKRESSMVFQEPALFDHLRVCENILYGLNSRDEALQKDLLSISEKLRIQPLLDKRAYALSGGQKQRVSMARALVRKPRIFLMDEPLQSLDEQLKSDLRLMIADLYQKSDATFLYVTHDQKEAMTLGERMFLMNEGKIVQSGTPQELYKQPESLFAAAFMDKYRLNIFSGRMNGVCFVPEMDAPLLGAVRSEHIHVIHPADPYDLVMQGYIRLVEELGSGAVLHVETQGRTVVIHAETEQHQRGEPITFGFHQKHIMLFDQRGNRIHKESISF